MVEGDGPTTQHLISLGFDHVFFTGGTEVGRKIMEAAAKTLTPVILELGGKSPVIVAEDADLDVTARRIAWVKLMNSGQTCIAPDYVLVHESVKDDLVARLSAVVTEFTSAEGPKRIVNRRQFDRLAGYLGQTSGSIVLGGDTDTGELTIAPTIVVIEFVNGRPAPLGLYVFTRDTDLADRIVDSVPAGGAVVNHCAIHYLMPELPFGGVGDSGIGAYHGEAGFQALSHLKSVAVKGFAVDPRIVYPPYGRVAQAVMRRLF